LDPKPVFIYDSFVKRRVAYIFCDAQFIFPNWFAKYFAPEQMNQNK